MEDFLLTVATKYSVHLAWRFWLNLLPTYSNVILRIHWDEETLESTRCKALTMAVDSASLLGRRFWMISLRHLRNTRRCHHHHYQYGLDCVAKLHSIWFTPARVASTAAMAMMMMERQQRYRSDSWLPCSIWSITITIRMLNLSERVILLLWEQHGMYLESFCNCGNSKGVESRK